MSFRNFAVVLIFIAGSVASRAQVSPMTCVASAVPTIVRAEGHSERVGDIILSCTGTPGGSVSGTLTVFLNVNDTNKITPSDTLDAVLSVDTGAGPVSAGASARLFNNSGVRFSPINFVLGPTGTASIRITNLRGAASQTGLQTDRLIVANFATEGPSAIAISNNNVVVATTIRGLLAAHSSVAVPCIGSPLPEDPITFSRLLADGTRFSSFRITEGSAQAFQRREPMADTGVRIMIRYNNFPSGARLFVPDVVAGSSAIQQTAGGDIGVPASGGVYEPTAQGSLLLSLVRGADANGAGGFPAYTPALPGSGQVAFDSVSEVQLTGGAGVAVYEVVDSHLSVLESAQIPTFFGFPQVTGAQVPIAGMRVSLAPLSTIVTASASAPVPRFLDTPPPQDCTALRDCNANYFPRLVVEPEPLDNLTAPAGSAFMVRYVNVRNEGGGIMNWTAFVAYKNGADWIRVVPAAGDRSTTVRLDILPEKLTPGLYEATLTIDGGPITGTRSVPIRLAVTQALPPPPQPPAILSVTNAANFQPGALVPGSLGTLKGSRLGGQQVHVTLDGVPVAVLFKSADQINFVVPSELQGRQSAQLRVTVDGISSNIFPVALASIAPAIFVNGVLNQDNSLNSATNPAQLGTVIQVFVTGLNLPSGWVGMARVHDREPTTPYYAGPAPNITGVQQMNVFIPTDLPPMTTDVRVCAVSAPDPGVRICSAPARITIRE
jgi:uncharacterized protein (TIGR03437 family)